MNVFGNCLEPYVLLDIRTLESFGEIILQIMSGQVGWHGEPFEVRVEGVVRVLETLFRGICPQVFIRRRNWYPVLVNFLSGYVIPLSAPFSLFLTTDYLKVFIIILFLQGPQ